MQKKDDNGSSRRSFLGTAAGASVLSTFAASGVHAQEATPETDLIPIGAVALSDNSHLNYGIWSPMINEGWEERWPAGRTTRMKITHCWDRDPQVAKDFAEKYGCTAVEHYDDMVGKVKGMIFGGFNEVPWWHKLTKPYLEAGIPCFINRPFAYSMKDAIEMVETAQKHNTPILCTDEREYIQQAIVARDKVRQFLSHNWRILGGHSSNASGEWPQHGVHGLYFLLAVFGLDVREAGYQADGWWKEVTPTATKQTYGQLSLLYDGIEIEDGGKQEQPFMVSQFQCWPRADITLRTYHSMGWWDIAHEYTPGDNGFPRHFFLFFPTIVAFQRMLETGEMQWSYDYILKKTQIYLAAFKSHVDHNGEMYPVADLPEDWTAPNPYADWLDESIFG